jgi:hypothetical protein
MNLCKRWRQSNNTFFSNKECKEGHDYSSYPCQDHKKEIKHQEFNDGLETALLVKCSHSLIQVQKEETQEDPGDPFAVSDTSQYHKYHQQQKENGLCVKDKYQVLRIVVSMSNVQKRNDQGKYRQKEKQGHRNP